MKRKLENIIKNNPVINKLYTFFGSMVVKIIGIFVKKQKNTVLFVSFMGKNFNDSPKDIYEAMLKTQEFNDFKYVWAFTDPDKYKMGKNTRTVKMDSFKYLVTALAADTWVTNVNIERGLHFKKKHTYYVNTWHGVPLKKVGNHVKGRNDFNFSTVDLFTYSSQFEKDVYLEAFRLKEANLFKYGMPRNDLVIHNSQLIKDKVKENLKISDKKIILYAPTWHDDIEDIADIDYKSWEKVLADEYVLLVKAHHFSKGAFSISNSFVHDVSDYENTNELIVAADILITDYSSIMFDFSILSKPILLLQKNIEKYKEERGVYFDLIDFKLSMFKDDKTLLDYIETGSFEQDILCSKAFGEKFIEVREPESTKKIIEMIFKEKAK